MRAFVDALNVLLPMAYAALAAGYAVAFLRDTERLPRALRPLLHSVVAAHAAYLAIRAITLDHLPMATVFEWLTMVAFALALVYWIIERVTGTQSTGVFVLGLAAAAQIASSVGIRADGAVNPVLRDPLFAIHAGASVLGYTAFGVAAVYGVLYFMLHRELKKATYGIVFSRLPALTTLGAMHEISVLVGVGALTLTILHGLLWLPRVYGWELADPMVVRTLLIWAAYLALAAAERLGWGRRALLIPLSVVAFVVLVLSTVAIRLWIPSFHAFT